MDDEAYEALVRGAAWRPRGGMLRRHLAAQTVLYTQPREDDLEALAEVLESHLSGQPLDATELGSRSTQPLWHFYRGVIGYQAGDDELARAALDRALSLDPGEPVARQLHAHLRGERLEPVSAGERLEVLSRMAGSLMTAPYERAVESIAAVARGGPRPRVLEVGVGAGTQIIALLERLTSDPGAVETLEVVGLDVVQEYLDGVESRLEAARGRLLPFTFEPVLGRIESIDDGTHERIARGAVTAINASIVLHEIPGQGKLTALENLGRFEQATLALAEWNFTTEKVLASREFLFLFNMRGAAAAMVRAVRPQHGLDTARNGVRIWLSQGNDQLAGGADERQECFLSADAWDQLLALTGWRSVRTATGPSGDDAPAPIVTWSATRPG